MIERLEHVALSVADLQRAIDFYTGLLGFTVLRVLEVAPPMRLGEINGLPGCSARIAHLDCGGTMLELFEYTQPRGRSVDASRTQADHGLIHFGMKTNSIHEDHARLAAAGVNFFGPPVEFRPGAWVVYFNGPDGEVVELRQT